MTRTRLALACLALAGCNGSGEVLRAGSDAGENPPVVLQQTEARLAAGQSHACAVVAGKLSCWGNSDTGQLGAPVGGDTGPRAIQTTGAVRAPAAGGGDRADGGHTCTLDTLGNVYCFGANDRGQLGTGDFDARSTPSLVALRAPAVDLRTSFDTSCALLADASLWCWGYNWEGQLGLGDTHPGTDRPAPVQIGTESDWVFVSTGQGHTCGIRSPGALYCWGRNTAMNLGQGSAEPQQIRSPARVGSDSDWVEVSAGQSTSCARKRNNTVYCWGSQDSGALGVGDTMPRSTPARVPNIDDWLSISTNTFHTCGVRRSGEIWCAGRNTEGQLAAPNTVDSIPNMQRMGSDADWVEVRAGRFFTCARKLDNSVWCTGDNRDGQVSNDPTVDRSNVLLQVKL